MRKEGIHIKIGIFPENIDTSFSLVVYTGAIPENHGELQKAKSLNIPTLSYSEALAGVANTKKLVTIA